MADNNAANCVQENLLELAPKIIMVARKRNLASEEANRLLQLAQPCEDDVEELSAGINTFLLHNYYDMCAHLCNAY